MTKEKKLNIFIPAQALEHVCNAENANLREKIRWALIRYYFNKDFFNPAYTRPAPSVYVEKQLLKTDPLGYAVEAVLKCE